MKLSTMITTLGIGAFTVTASIGADNAVTDTLEVNPLTVIASIGTDNAVTDTQEVGAITATASVGAGDAVTDTQEGSKVQESECPHCKKDCPKAKACPHTDKAKCESVKKKGCCPAKSAE